VGCICSRAILVLNPDVAIVVISWLDIDDVTRQAKTILMTRMTAERRQNGQGSERKV